MDYTPGYREPINFNSLRVKLGITSGMLAIESIVKALSEE